MNSLEIVCTGKKKISSVLVNIFAQLIINKYLFSIYYGESTMPKPEK